MDSAIEVAVLAGLLIFTLLMLLITAIDCRNKDKARDALQDYMWCKGAKEFFGVDVKDRELKKRGIVFDDFLEEEHARLISSRVL